MDQLTIVQYEIMAEAARLKEVDKDYRNHLQAFLNFAVRAKKKAGKNKQRPVYPTFKKFYDYEDAIEQAKQKNKLDRFEKMKRLLRRRES